MELEDKLQTWNRKLHTAISIQKKSCLCEDLTHDLHVTARHSTDKTVEHTFTLQQDTLPTRLCWTHCNIHSPDYLFTAGKYIHEATLLSTHNCFCSAKKDIREAWAHDLHITAQCSTTPKKKKEKLSLWGSNSQPSRYSTMLYHTVTAPRTTGGQKQTNF